jgi:hypothetical protein
MVDYVPEAHFVEAVHLKDSVNPASGRTHAPGRALPTLARQLPKLREKYKDVKNPFDYLSLPSQQGVVVEDAEGVPLICVIRGVLSQEIQVCFKLESPPSRPNH